MASPPPPSDFFFFNDTATTEIYTLSLHDALPIFRRLVGVVGIEQVEIEEDAAVRGGPAQPLQRPVDQQGRPVLDGEDRKSTRLNSSHANISYAVFCLKKKNTSRTEKERETRVAHD